MGIVRGCEMTMGYIAHTVFRFLQAVLAFSVIGLYGTDVNKANKEHKYSDGKWVRTLQSPCGKVEAHSL